MANNLTAEQREALATLGSTFGPLGQRSLRQRFYAQVDLEFPDAEPDLRERLARAFYHRHMAELGRQSGRARRGSAPLRTSGSRK